MNQRETGDLGQGSVGKLLLRLALPTITAQLVNALYNMVDRIYIGHIPVVGRTALTGVGVCMSLIMIISAFAALTAMAGPPGPPFSWAGRRAGAEKILGNCVTGAVSAGLILTVVFLIFSRPLLMAFGASEETIGYAVQYMKIYALGTVFVELAGAQCLYHRSGICLCGHGQCAHWRGGQHDSGRRLFWAWEGVAGAAGHHHLPGPVRPVGGAVLLGKKVLACAPAGEPGAGLEALWAVPGSGPVSPLSCSPRRALSLCASTPPSSATAGIWRWEP